MQTQRINITLPRDLARDLRRSVPERSRSKFIAETLQEKLNKRRNLKRDLIRSRKQNSDFYKKIAKEIEEDFKYADAEISKRVP